MFNFGFDPEQFASLGSSFDEPDPFSPTPVASIAPIAPIAEQPITQKQAAANSQALADKQKAEGLWEAGQKGVGSGVSSHKLPNQSEITYDSGSVYGTTEEALGNFSSFLGGLDTQYKDTTNKYGLMQFDPSDYVRSGLSGPRALGTNASKDALNTYVKDNNIPLTQERDGVTYHLTGGNDRNNDALHGMVSDGIWQDQGAVGTYSTVYIDTSTSMFQDIINNPVVNIAANFIPGGTLALTAAKAASGQTLHGMDYASAALSGFELSKTLQAPVNASKAADVGRAAADASVVAGKTSFEAMTNAAKTAEASALAGKGFKILGKELSYAASKGLINAVAVGDPKAAIIGTFGGELVAEGLEKVGIGGLNPDGTAITSWKGIQIDDLSAGLTKAVEEVGNGRDVDEALVMGLGKYIREGGTLGAGTADTLTEVVRDVVRPIGAAATDLYKLVEGAIPKGTDVNLDKVKEVLSEANRLARQGASATDTLARKGLSEIDDEFIQPITKPAGMLLSAADTLARKGLSEIDDRVINPAGDLLSAVDTAARQELTKLDEGLYDVQSPFSTPHFNSLDGPEIDIDIDLPSFNFDSSRKGMLSGATTGKIFGDELFKFKNNIELTEFGPMFVEKEQEVDIEEFLTSPFESAFTSSERFA